jgi:hypothetical protein
MPFFILSSFLEIEVHLTQSKIHVADGTVSHESSFRQQR